MAAPSAGAWSFDHEPPACLRSAKPLRAGSRRFMGLALQALAHESLARSAHELPLERLLVALLHFVGLCALRLAFGGLFRRRRERNDEREHESNRFHYSSSRKPCAGAPPPRVERSPVCSRARSVASAIFGAFSSLSAYQRSSSLCAISRPPSPNDSPKASTTRATAPIKSVFTSSCAMPIWFTATMMAKTQTAARATLAMMSGWRKPALAVAPRSTAAAALARRPP